jgi:F-type H+-transporting ATPase subunit b
MIEIILLKKLLSSAEKAKAEMEQLSANNDKDINEARIERDSIIKEARE